MHVAWLGSVRVVDSICSKMQDSRIPAVRIQRQGRKLRLNLCGSRRFPVVPETAHGAGVDTTSNRSGDGTVPLLIKRA